MTGVNASFPLMCVTGVHRPANIWIMPQVSNTRKFISLGKDINYLFELVFNVKLINLTISYRFDKMI